MSLFSSDDRRLDAIRDIISPLAVFDPAQARQLVDQYVHDPSQHTEMSRVIDDIEARQTSPGPGRPGPMTGGFNTAIGIREGIAH